MDLGAIVIEHLGWIDRVRARVVLPLAVVATGLLIWHPSLPGAAAAAVVILLWLALAVLSTMIRRSWRRRADAGDVPFEQLLPLPECTVGPGETRKLAIRPERPFHPRRLMLASCVAHRFLITELRIAGASYLEAPTRADLFLEYALPIVPRLEWIVPPHCVVLVVRNVSRETATFRGCFVGKSISLAAIALERVREAGGDAELWGDAVNHHPWWRP